MHTTRGTPHVDFDQRIKKRTKKPKSLNMVHVKMAKQNIDSRGCSKMRPQTANSGARVQHQYGSVFPAHLYGCSVTSVSDRFRSWRGYGAAGAEERDTHHCDTSQNKAAAPTKSP